MIEQLFNNKPKSIHDIIPSEFFTKYDSYDYVWSGNCFEWYYAISKTIQPKTFLEIGDADNIDDIDLRFNGDTGANYTVQNHSINQTSGALSTDYSTTGTNIYRNAMPANTANNGTNTFGQAEFYIQNYTSNSAYKPVFATHSSIVNQNYTGNYLGYTGSFWRSTSPITSISLICDQASWMQYSRFDLYGIY